MQQHFRQLFLQGSTEDWSNSHGVCHRVSSSPEGSLTSEGVLAWWDHRLAASERAALTKDQQHLVQTQVGKNLTLKSIEQSMYQVFSQDYRQTYLAKGFAKGKGRQQIMHADDSYDGGSEWQEYYETDEVYWDEAGESPDHEGYYDPNDETWNDTCYETEESYQDESLFDIQEYDEAYTAYTDAKQRTQQLRQARGFYPVVALMGNMQMPLAASGEGQGQKVKETHQSSTVCLQGS